MIKRGTVYLFTLMFLNKLVSAAGFETTVQTSPSNSNLLVFVFTFVVILAAFFIIYKILKSNKKTRRKK
ncbi:MAG TPA: hypothetical protein VJH20_02060 [Candidatus Nanoarchaeia archaeon]|nr:hypothetical protein [Candidatus Nanoarchaeia archaeon]